MSNASYRFYNLATSAILKALDKGACTVQADQNGLVRLYDHSTVIWGVDQTAYAELSENCTAIRCRKGSPWVNLSADQQRMAKMAAAVAKAAFAKSEADNKAEELANAAMVGQEIDLTVSGGYGSPDVTGRWTITYVDYGCAVAEPVGLTEAQRSSQSLLARRVSKNAAGQYVAGGKAYCLPAR